MNNMVDVLMAGIGGGLAGFGLIVGHQAIARAKLKRKRIKREEEMRRVIWWEESLCEGYVNNYVVIPVEEPR